MVEGRWEAGACLTSSAPWCWGGNRLISAKLPQIGFGCLAHSKSFQCAQMQQGWCHLMGDSTWRPSGGTSIPSDQCAYLNPLPVFLVLLKRPPKNLGPEPTKMRNSSHDFSVNLWLLPSRGHAASVFTTTARKNENFLGSMYLDIYNVTHFALITWALSSAEIWRHNFIV